MEGKWEKQDCAEGEVRPRQAQWEAQQFSGEF